MPNPFDPDDFPDEVLWEMSDEHSFWSEDLYEWEIPRYTNETYTHEDIVRYQRQLSQSANVNVPTRNEWVNWIYADNLTKKYKRNTKNSGKWLIFSSPSNIDDLWEKVVTALNAGKLGVTAKCSTIKSFKKPDYVICVYTYDYTDKKDVMRVREALRRIGVTKQIPYKTDEDTLARKYVKNGNKNISKYYE